MTTLHCCPQHAPQHPETDGWLAKARASDKAARAPTMARLLRLFKRANIAATLSPLVHFGAYTYTAALSIDGCPDVQIVVEVGHVRLWRDTVQIPVRKWLATDDYIGGVFSSLWERTIVVRAKEAEEADRLAKLREWTRPVPGTRMTVRQLREMTAGLPDHMIVVVPGPEGRYMPADATATKAHCTGDGDLADYYGSDGTGRSVDVLVIS